MAPLIVDLNETAPKPWKNGAGLTREIAVEPADAAMDNFDWRISVAGITRDAPFSTFAGVDRCIVLLQGRGMRLRSANGAIDAWLDTPLQPFRFSGDEPVHASLIDGACTDFNVMVRQSSWHAEVMAVRETRSIDEARAALVYCVKGHTSVDAPADAAITLRDGLGALWRTGAPRRTVHVHAAGTQLLIVQLNALREDASA